MDIKLTNTSVKLLSQGNMWQYITHIENPLEKKRIKKTSERKPSANQIKGAQTLADVAQHEP